MIIDLFLFEIIVLGGLFLVQVYVFRKTKTRIDEMGTLIENPDNLVLSRLSIPVEDLNEMTPAQILRNRAQYSGVIDPEPQKEANVGEAWQSSSQDDDWGNAEEDSDEDQNETDGFEDYDEDGDSGEEDEGAERADWENDDEDELSEVEASQNDEEDFQSERRNRQKRTYITIIEGPDTASPGFRKTLDTINTYIISNKSGTADFGLIKEVTERSAEAIEEEVNLTISVPLFLGLMGTMLGIIFGVISMSSVLLPEDPNKEKASSIAEATATNNLAPTPSPSSKTDSTPDAGTQTREGMRQLLKSVGLAMSVSLIGLFLTTLNSGWFLKKEKLVLDARKNDFYSFMQTSLLPVIDQSMGSSLQSLQANLAKFNHEFSSNLQDLNSLFGDIGTVLKNQHDVMEKLENMDVNNIATYNVKVLSELTQSLDALNSFKQHLEIVVTGVERSEQLLDRFDSILNRTSDVTDIASRLEATVSEGKALMEFLTKHKDSLEKFEQSTSGAISETGLNISDMFKKLEEHIGESIQQISNFTADEAVILRDAVSEGRLNLGNLSFLENINDVLRTIRDNADKTNANLSPQLEKMSKSMDNLNRVLGDLEKKVASMQQGGGGIRKLFGGGPKSGDGA